MVTLSQLVMVKHEIRWRRLFKGSWKYLVSGAVMYLIVSRICQTINMTVANLVLEVIVGVFAYGVMLVVTKAKILQQGLTIIKGKNK